MFSSADVLVEGRVLLLVQKSSSLFAAVGFERLVVVDSGSALVGRVLPLVLDVSSVFVVVGRVRLLVVDLSSGAAVVGIVILLV